MPKLRKPPETPSAAKDAFVREVKVRRAYCDMTQKELAEEVGVVPSVMSNLLSDPDKISIGRLRTIVQALDLDIEVILKLVGYLGKDIDKFKASCTKG